jgi:CO/xanthine dehydrogenase Mo-binding subunit
MRAVGVSRPRADSVPKVRGTTRYAADRPIADLLHGRLVLSSEAHAEIRSIDSTAALSTPGVVAVLTAGDLPLAGVGKGRTYEPLARSEVVFAGQPVALVVAASEASAEDGVEGVVVDYAPLPVVLDLEEAMAPGAPSARLAQQGAEAAGMESIHAAVGGGEQQLPEEELSANVVGEEFYADGNVEAALEASEAVVAARFGTSWIYQGYVEPQTATAWVEPDGEVVVSSSTQGAFFTRDELAKLFGLERGWIRVHAAPLGGAFGGKLLIVEPLAAAAALRLRRPVRVVFTRSEDFAASNPAPAERIELRVGAERDGRLTALDARVVADRGANDEWGVEGISAMLVAGPYRWPAYAIRGYGVQTNRFGLGAYRGPGATPAAFAIESMLDELAERLALDPIELRLRNVVSEGDRGVDGKAFPVMGARECLDRVRAHPLWAGRQSLPPDEGIGVALGWWPGGNEPAAAACRLDGDGTLTVVTAAVDMTGTHTAFAAIAADAFGVPPERVRVVMADTSSAPFAGVSGGSKVTYTVGRAVQRAAVEARERLVRMAADELEAAPDDLDVVDGQVQVVGAPSRSVSIERLAERSLSWGSRYEPIEGRGGSAQTSLAPSSAVHLSHVRIARETGEVALLHHVIAQDVGRALNPALVEGQMRGGTAQGLGWALYEELVHDEHGQLMTSSFLDYAIPSAERIPEIETLVVEVPAPDGPFGAKGIGEAPVIAVAPAVANAIAHATGVRLRALPMTAPRVWAALRKPSA